MPEPTAIKYTGAGEVQATDTKYVKWVGTTKSGQAVTIVIPKAICLSNPEWTFAEKDDVVPEVEFTGLYTDTALSSGDRTEPWSVEFTSAVTAGTGEIILGAGKFYVGTNSSDATCVGLTRGGGSFTVEREYRNINADGDPGAVEGRIVQEGGQPKLKLNTLQWLTKLPSLYAGIKSAT